MKHIISVDLGSVSISFVCMDMQGKVLEQSYVFHQGNPGQALEELTREMDVGSVVGISSPSGRSIFREHVQVYDVQLSLMKAAGHADPGTRSILHVGAERFFLLELDEQGRYRQTSHSSSCAAGTGSFLDQQAVRLKLGGAAELSEMALGNEASIPDIAARCSVFAKTDLIHAQQKGYGLDAICDSLCKGLAENLVSTLFAKADPVPPLMMTGGVARNAAVVRHLETMLGTEILVPAHAPHLPAIGAGLLLLDELKGGRVKPGGTGLELLQDPGQKHYHFKALVPPSRASGQEPRMEGFTPLQVEHPSAVQVDTFGEGKGAAYLGIDVGSTSTKAVLVDMDGEPLKGFYTYTSGQPLKATQAILEAMNHAYEGDVPEILGCGTTGSGRKFIGAIVGADQDVDEITAHARAAYELNPLTDTIIEIGGQDAKFTQMRDGVVTFSHMNTVCAAGTGSFIEELAGRLGVELEDYQELAMGRKAPLASDRCTVFMERDINQLLNRGYQVEEVLATVIHSVRENYLKKVASEAHIGEHICFQGATARNLALVAAFEQRLGKDIFVSPLCHLTGALGTALLLREEFRGRSTFRGVELYRKDIPVRTERCELCLNKCAISLAGVNGEQVAYGFLCGRDYDTQHFVQKPDALPDMARLRRKLEREWGRQQAPDESGSPVGLPAVLHMVEDHFFWKQFFADLGIPVESSETYRDGLKRGKGMAGAEFCAPMDNMYGHVNYLAGKCKAVFFPVYLETRAPAGEGEENLCYYTQYAASLAHMEQGREAGRVHSPMLDFGKAAGHNAGILSTALEEMGYGVFEQTKVKKALEFAGKRAEQLKRALRDQMQEGMQGRAGQASVALLGRPYVLLSEAMNKGIPGIFSGMGVAAFYQDMLPLEGDEKEEALEGLLEKIPWHFAAQILRAAHRVCQIPGLYPVLVTAFKCAPDSFIISYFEQMMQLWGKPYLIIQIDEHDSNTGYETRIEAALRSFRNHLSRNGEEGPAKEPSMAGILPKVDHRIGKRTLLLPNWDMDVSPLIVANLRRAGYDAHLLESSEMGIRRSMVHNTGQCLPINIIAQDYMDYMEKYKLEPSHCILWMMESHLSCNLRQYPFYIKRILENHGRGMEKAAVYSGELTHRELSLDVTYYAYFAYMLGGLFRKVACRIRPYEQEEGTTDRAYAAVKEILVRAMSGKQRLDSAVREGLDLFRKVDWDREARKPLVAIFGDFYVRDNEIMNQDLVRDIESAGGEVLTTPYHEYSQLSIENIFRRALKRGEHVKTAFNRTLLNVLKYVDDRYYRHFEFFLGPSPAIRPRELEKRLKDFGVDLMNSGESYDNLLKIFYLLENHPDVSLFVQTNPAFCCPALVTEAMTRKIREETGVPIVTLTYDGTSDRRNEVIVPYIQSAVESRE